MWTIYTLLTISILYLLSYLFLRNPAVLTFFIKIYSFLCKQNIRIFYVIIFFFSSLPLFFIYSFLTTEWSFFHIWWQFYSIEHLNLPATFYTYELILMQNISLVLLVDELAIFFSLMSVLIIMFLLSVTYLTSVKKSYFVYLYLLYLEYILIFVFLAHDFITFFIAFELALIPMFILIVFFGSGKNTKKAAYWFFIFTLISSIFLIIPITYIYVYYGLLNFSEVQFFFSEINSDNNFISLVLCLMFFISFSIKLPLMPLHIWLPEVHVEAPTLGSMILASLLLKLGGYGIVRICLGLFPVSFQEILVLLTPLILLSIISSGAIAAIQTDIKKIIAYSSISHMSVALLGLVFCNSSGYIGSLLCMFAHSFTSPALFFIVGCLYDRYHTRNIFYFGGLSRVMPIFTGLFFLYILSNIAFPGFLNFIGEVYIIIGFILINFNSYYIYVLFLLGIFFVTSYNLLIFSRICWGNLNWRTLKFNYDVTAVEFSFLFTILTFLIFFGFEPEILLALINDNNLRMIC